MTDASPIFCFVSMEKDLIIKSIEPAVNQRGCFIVDVSLSRDNDIVLTVEKEVGEMDLEDCVAINDAFLAIFDKDAEDYSLTVSSAGLDQPFKVEKQYRKAIGSSVSVLLKGGRKLSGSAEYRESGTLTRVIKSVPADTANFIRQPIPSLDHS